MVCTIRPEKDKPNQTRITAGGNLLNNYPGETSTNMAGLELIRIYWQSELSTKNEKIPQEVIDEYDPNPESK